MKQLTEKAARFIIIIIRCLHILPQNQISSNIISLRQVKLNLD